MQRIMQGEFYLRSLSVLQMAGIKFQRYNIFPFLQESKKNLRGKIDWADAIALVYSVASRRSFSEANSIMEAIDKASPAKRKPILLIANKIDLRHRRTVPVSDGQLFAKRW